MLKKDPVTELKESAARLLQSIDRKEERVDSARNAIKISNGFKGAQKMTEQWKKTEALPEDHEIVGEEGEKFEPDEDDRYYNNFHACFPDLDLSDATGYCISSGKKTYLDWERDVANPALEKDGYKVIAWLNGEADSFGPLIRYCIAKKDGQKFRFLYG